MGVRPVLWSALEGERLTYRQHQPRAGVTRVSPVLGPWETGKTVERVWGCCCTLLNGGERAAR
jgi:hypothetical protein